MTIKINYKKCCWKDGGCASCKCGGACTGCAEVCPAEAIKRGQKIEIDQSKCISCGACITACKHEALSMI